MRKLFFSIIYLLLSVFAMAQDNPNPETSGLRADGKIYVVMAVVITILIGLIIYLIRLDRKISQLEGKNEIISKK